MARRCVRRGRSSSGKKVCRRFSGGKAKGKRKRRCALSETRGGRRVCLKYVKRGHKNPYIY
jgi:hypothetical protein